MKKILLIIAAALFIGQPIMAQGELGLFVGYGQSTFDKDLFSGTDYSQAGYIPVGARLLMGVGMFQLGVEVNYAAVPFTFEVKGGSPEIKVADWKITQLYYGALAKIRIGSGSGIHPYARAGAGMYTGELKLEFSDEAKNQDPTLEDASEKYKSAFGFNLGGGISIDVASNTGLFAEVVFHIVRRELDMEGAEKLSFNNYAIHVGVNFGL